MIAKFLFAAAALFAALSPATARAEARSVPRAPVIGAFAACAARQLPDRSRALMATPLGSRAERDAARRMAESRSGCVRREFDYLPMNTGEFRGAVAEALLEADPDALARLRTLPPAPAVRAPRSAGRAFVAAYARCIADADPAGSVRLLSQPHEAPPAEQREAFLAFGDILNDCMPMGSAYAIDEFDVRNHIAARLYALAYPSAESSRR